MKGCNFHIIYGIVWYSRNMSKMRFRWLWVIIALEVLAIAGLLIWALAFRQTNQPTQEQTNQPAQDEPSYNAPQVELRQVATGFARPTAIASMPMASDKRLFIIEQVGTVRVINEDKSVDSTPFLDIRSKVLNNGEMGLLGLAFHPKVTENNFFYVNYVDRSRNTVIARYTIGPNGRADQNSEKILLKIPQPYTNHNGGQLAFGPDGYLYIGLGDGGSAGDPNNRAQNKDELLGKILRISVDPYDIPAGNPFASGGGRPEIWALGLRNPWRFSFDRQTGDLYIADVGQGELEEINFQPSTSRGGENYGWRCFEGPRAYNTDGCESENAYVKPILEYDHSDGRCSITGGYVYRGSQYPALIGRYFYGDYCNGQIFYAQQAGGNWESALAIATTIKISTFGENSVGELFVADYDGGTIYQIIDTAN